MGNNGLVAYKCMRAIFYVSDCTPVAAGDIKAFLAKEDHDGDACSS